MGFFILAFWIKKKLHHYHHKGHKIKCARCRHNIIFSKRYKRWLHRNYNPGLQPGEDGDHPSEFGYVEFTPGCKYKNCNCKTPFPKHR